MPESRDGAPEGAKRLQCRDEVLQLLFWLAGEGFEAEMTLQGVARFLARPASEVEPVLEDAIAAGLVERVPTERYELTRAGRREGGRRFSEEFAGMQALQAHAANCTDPDCDCHTSAQAAQTCIHEREGGHHHEDRNRR
jgi:quinol monooxygenase YgiN